MCVLVLCFKCIVYVLVISLNLTILKIILAKNNYLCQQQKTTKSFQILLLIFSIHLNSQTTQVGNGSYTNTFPGTDTAGRNGFPSGTPQLSGDAVGKPVPTNDWWSKLIKENHADNLFNYPMTMKTTKQTSLFLF